MFWDSSAIVPCLVPEARSSDTTALFSQDNTVTIWWATPAECSSALEAKKRDQSNPLPLSIYTTAYQRLAAIVAGSHHVDPSEALRDKAIEYLKRHRLRAADAFQLAAAFTAHQSTMVCLDIDLRGAAQAEGFVVLP